MGLTVTQLAYAFGGSNPSLPTPFRHQECGSSSVDRALAFQAKGRGFEPRLPLNRIKPRAFLNAFGFSSYIVNYITFE